MDLNYVIVPRTERQITGADGEVKHPFRLVVGTSTTGRRYIPVDICESLEFWDKGTESFYIDLQSRDPKVKERNARYKQINSQLISIKHKCLQIIEEFKIINKGQHLTPSIFVDKYTTKRSGLDRIEEYWLNHIKELRETKHIGDSKTKQWALAKIKVFDPKFASRSFDDIDLAYVKRYDQWMQKPRSTTYTKSSANLKKPRVVKREPNSGTTRLHAHKTLRAILNKAKKDGVTTGSNYPYGTGGFSVSSLSEVSDNRYLTREIMDRIKNTPMSKPYLEIARHIFLAQYYSYGISWIDAANLTSKNIIELNSGKFLKYRRNKTIEAKNSSHIQPPIEADGLGLHLDWFKENCDLVDDYIFPIVSVAGKQGEELYDHIRARLNTITKYLKEMAEILGIKDVKLTSYVSRHTYAETLNQAGVPLSILSASLGHKDLKTTQIYLASLSAENIADATRGIL